MGENVMSFKGINRIAIEGSVPVECPHGYDACPECDWNGVGNRPTAVSRRGVSIEPHQKKNDYKHINKGSAIWNACYTSRNTAYMFLYCNGSITWERGNRIGKCHDCGTVYRSIPRTYKK